MRLARVSSFFADNTQQLHSLRASGVMSSQVFFASASAFIAFIKSAGGVWGSFVSGFAAGFFAGMEYYFGVLPSAFFFGAAGRCAAISAAFSFATWRGLSDISGGTMKSGAS